MAEFVLWQKGANNRAYKNVADYSDFQYILIYNIVIQVPWVVLLNRSSLQHAHVV